MGTDIAWTDETWNPTTGCDRVSPGCDHCYAMTLAKRLKGMGSAKYQNDGDPRTSGPGFGLTVHPDALDLPLRWKKPRRVFVNSMSDLFHPDVPPAFVAQVFDVMARASQHTFQVLTKRPQRMRALASGATFNGGHGAYPLPNVWLGTSVENQRYADMRIPHLLATPAAVRFLSVEPMLGPIDLEDWLDGCDHDTDWYDTGRRPGEQKCSLCGERRLQIDDPNGNVWLTDLTERDPERRDRKVRYERVADGRSPRIDWVIVGGESGRGARPMEREWAESIVEQCEAAGVAVFVKQLGTVLGGKRHADVETFPASLQVREYPDAR